MATDQQTKRLSTDIVIIGGGGTGLAAAVAAAEKGAKVILLEKQGAPGGNSAMAVGLLAADSPVQKRMCVWAPKDEVFNLAMDYSHWKANPRIWRAFVDKSGDTIQWLEEKGLKFNEIPSMFPGQVIRTYHCVERMKFAGPAFIKLFRKVATDLGVRILTRTPAKKLLMNEKGQLEGVLAQTKEGEIEVSAKSVIIAAGGYGGSREMLKKYYPTYHENMKYTGFPHVTGDGIVMAIEAGAATEGLGTLMVHPVLYPKSAHVSIVAAHPYMLWVNKNGERFTRETLTFNYTECGNAIDRQPEKITYALFDDKTKETIIEEGILALGLAETGIFAGAKLTELTKELTAEADRGEVKVSDSWGEIAGWMGIAPQVLEATIDEYNVACDHGHDTLFAKDQRYLLGLRTPPFYAVRCYQSFLTTVGGIKINHHMEVLDPEDEPIAGLYAGGDNAGGWEGDTYCIILAGSAFGFAINSGRIAGENAAAYVLEK
jgi:fumarate reductase flavoprotein subunit